MKRFLLTFALLCGLQICSLAQDSVVAADPEDLFLDAMLAMEKEDYKQAATLFEQLKKADPSNDAADLYLGFLYDGVSGKAEDNYRSAVQKDSSNFWYNYYLARHYLNTEREDLATAILEGLVAKYPRKTDLYYDLINIYLRQNDIDRALDVLGKIETASGRTEQVGVMGADLRLRKGDYDGAYAYLEDFYGDCSTPRIATMLGDRYVQLYRDSIAMKYYQEAIALDPEYMPAYYGRAHVLRDRRDYDGYFRDITRFMASRDIETDIKTEYLGQLMQTPQFVRAFSFQVDSLVKAAYHSAPEDSTLAIFTAYYMYNTGQTEEALEVLLDNRDRHPESFQAKFECLMYWYSSQNWREIVSMTGEMVAEYPDKVDIFQLKGISHWQLDETDDAIECYRRMTEINPRDSATIVIACTALGDLYHLKGDRKNAYRCYDRVLRVNGSYLPVLNNYAYYLSEEGASLKKAYRMSQITIKEEPDNATYLDTYGWILFLMDKPVEAKAIFKHAMLYGGKESAVMLDHYAEVLFRLKEYDLAFIYWNQARQIDPELHLEEKISQRKAQMK